MEQATPVLITEILKGTAIEAATQAAGIAVPGIGKIMLSYKQKKMKRNFELLISKIVDLQDEINKRLAKLEDKEIEIIQNEYFGLISDYTVDVKQEEKIEYIVNGFVNVINKGNTKEDIVLMYYDTLEQLNILDIRILKCYYNPPYIWERPVGKDDIVSLMEEYTMDYSQTVLIKEKLLKLGLLDSRNDLDMDSNIQDMATYLEA